MFNRYYLLGGLLILVCLLVGVWLVVEGDFTPPNIILSKDIEFLGQNQELRFSVEDGKSGVGLAQVSIVQGDNIREISRFDFPKKGEFRKELELNIQPRSLGLKDGKARLIISARDSSLFGNETKLERELTVDTVPPQLGIQSLNHYISMGGSCLAVYNVSKDTVKSGILVGETHFRGYPATAEGGRIAYFALPWNASASTPILLMAEDSAGNATKVSFAYLVLKKRFREAKINISDDFLDRKMPEFSARYDNLQGNNLGIYLKVNSELRQESDGKIREICNKSHPERLWEGPFLRMKGSPKAGFGDKRIYYYQGKAIDRQVHLGVDIAALQQFPVEAANNGIIVFADDMGIYGNTIIIDHGQGLFSMYSHLSSFKGKPGTQVTKGGVIGNTGTTGLAGGDHLHFGMIVQGIFVNPKEWWDAHWIKDNVTAKLQPEKSD
ncbi:MAG: M23 family metallopeptidase [Pseudomonadota bacterium]